LGLWARRFGSGSGVPSDQLSVDRVRKRFVNRRVDVAHRLGTESGLAENPSMGEETGVESIQHRGRDIGEALLAEFGKHMEVKAAAVGLVCAGFDPHPNRREPVVVYPLREGAFVCVNVVACR
jgi:hypothetical protein